MAGQVAGLLEVDHPVVVQLVEVGRGHLHLGHPGPAGLGGQLGEVLLGLEADRRGLDPHRQVLGHQRDVGALDGEVVGDREDPRVVVAEPEARRQRGGVGVVQLDPDGAAGVTDGDGLVEPAVQDAQLVEGPQGGTGEVAELGMVALALQLGDDHDRENDLVLVEPAERAGVGEQDAGVQDERAGSRLRCGGAPLCSHGSTPRRPTRALAPGPVRSL